jgi:hypothetical protein
MTTSPSLGRPEDHPIVVQAANYFVTGHGAFTQESLQKLQHSLEALAGKVELGWALECLVLFAQYLDKKHEATAAADALLDVAMTQTFALEQLNKQMEELNADNDRNRHKAFNKFTGSS